MPLDYNMSPQDFQAALQRLQEYRRKKLEEQRRQEEEKAAYQSNLEQYGLKGTTDDMGQRIDPKKRLSTRESIIDEAKGAASFLPELGKVVISNALDTPRQLLQIPSIVPSLAAAGAKKMGIESAALEKAAQLSAAMTGGAEQALSGMTGGLSGRVKKWNEENVAEASAHTIGGDISNNDFLATMQLLPAGLGTAAAQMIGPAEIAAPGKALQGLGKAGKALKNVVGDTLKLDPFGNKAAAATAKAQALASARLAREAEIASKQLILDAEKQAIAMRSRELANGIFDKAGVPREMTPDQAIAEVDAMTEAARRRKIDELFGIEQQVKLDKEMEEVAKMQDPMALAAELDDLKRSMQNPLPSVDDLFQMKDEMAMQSENEMIASLGRDDWNDFWDTPSQAGQEIFERTKFTGRDGITIDLSGETPVIDMVTPYPEQGPEWTKRPRVITSMKDPLITSRRAGSHAIGRAVRDQGAYEVPGETLVSPDLTGTGTYGMHSLTAPNSKVATEMVISAQEAAHDTVRSAMVGRADIEANKASELLAEHVLGISNKPPTQIGAALAASEEAAIAARTNADTFAAQLDGLLEEKAMMDEGMDLTSEGHNLLPRAAYSAYEDLDQMINEKVGLMTEDVGKALEKIKKLRKASNAKLKEQGLESVEDMTKDAKPPEQVYDPEQIYSMHQRYTEIVEAAVFKAKKQVKATYSDWIKKGDVDPSFSPDDILQKVEKEIRDQADSDMRVLAKESQKLSHEKIAEKLKLMGNKMVNKHDLKPYKFAARCK